MFRLKLAFVIAAFAFQQEDPPPEPPDDVVECMNTGEHPCTCAQGALPDGRHDAPPDHEHNIGWCRTYCKKNKCCCAVPKHMPQTQ